MTDKTDTPPKKKGLVKRLAIPLLAVLVLGGAGAAGGYFMGMSSAEAKAEPEPDRPQLVLREGASPSSGDSGGDGTFDKSRYKASYYQLEAPFTSNLKESDSFVQLTLGLSTYYDGKVIEGVKAHEMAVRSAVLMRLSEQDELVLASPQGKEMLQRDIADTVNRVLRERTGFGGIDNVYFTSLVVQ